VFCGEDPQATRRDRSRKKRSAAGGSRPGRELDFRPLKRRIKTDIDKLSAVERPSRQVKSALASLKRVQRDLTKACLPTMVIGFP
jgi:hypothetical protein